MFTKWWQQYGVFEESVCVLFGVQSGNPLSGLIRLVMVGLKDDWWGLEFVSGMVCCKWGRMLPGLVSMGMGFCSGLLNISFSSHVGPRLPFWMSLPLLIFGFTHPNISSVVDSIKDQMPIYMSWLRWFFPRREAGGFMMSPPVWNLRAASLIPLFYISSLVLLPSPAAISVLPFSAFDPFSWSVFP